MKKVILLIIISTVSIFGQDWFGNELYYFERRGGKIGEIVLNPNGNLPIHQSSVLGLQLDKMSSSFEEMNISPRDLEYGIIRSAQDIYKSKRGRIKNNKSIIHSQNYFLWSDHFTVFAKHDNGQLKESGNMRLIGGMIRKSKSITKFGEWKGWYKDGKLKWVGNFDYMTSLPLGRHTVIYPSGWLKYEYIFGTGDHVKGDGDGRNYPGEVGILKSKKEYEESDNMIPFWEAKNDKNYQEALRLAEIYYTDSVDSKDEFKLVKMSNSILSEKTYQTFIYSGLIKIRKKTRSFDESYYADLIWDYNRKRGVNPLAMDGSARISDNELRRLQERAYRTYYIVDYKKVSTTYNCKDGKCTKD